MDKTSKVTDTIAKVTDRAPKVTDTIVKIPNKTANKDAPLKK
ncbi:hypothetical protein AB9L15_12585 [Lysinibacillus fusiformis]